MTPAITRRRGSVPTTRYAIPHQQLDQNPPRAIYEALFERFIAIPDTTNGPSLISVPGARALFLTCEAPCNERAFLRGREFAHLHPPEDGSFHMILSPEDCDLVLASGWGELHPLAATRQFHPTRRSIQLSSPFDGPASKTSGGARGVDGSGAVGRADGAGFDGACRAPP